MYTWYWKKEKFDRYNDALFSKSLTRHKKEPSTQLWEFGIPDLSVERMLPPEQVFPNYSGGFITTDATNIICRPSIIDDICNEIEKVCIVFIYCIYLIQSY